MCDSCETVKILDGIYLGNQDSARDEEFLLLNHVTLVVNMAKLPNYYQHYSIHYLNVLWPVKKSQDIFQSIEQKREEGESVLIHGEDTIETSACLIAVYLMQKFRWSLFKTLQYLQTRIHNLIFSSSSFDILKQKEMSLLELSQKLTYNWESRPEDKEELLLRNTFLNCSEGRQKVKSIISKEGDLKQKIKPKRRIEWDLPVVKMIKHKKSIKDVVNSTQDQLRSKIIMSVRNILNPNNKNQSYKKKQNKEQSDIRVLSKHKSSYGLISLKSSLQEQTSKTSIKTEKSRLMTERIENEEESFSVTSRIKTEQEEIHGKKVINVRIPLSNIMTNCKSLSLKEKESLSKLKVSLRPTTK